MFYKNRRKLFPIIHKFKGDVEEQTNDCKGSGGLLSEDLHFDESIRPVAGNWVKGVLFYPNVVKKSSRDAEAWRS